MSQGRRQGCSLLGSCVETQLLMRGGLGVLCWGWSFLQVLACQVALVGGQAAAAGAGLPLQPCAGLQGVDGVGQPPCPGSMMQAA